MTAIEPQTSSNRVPQYIGVRLTADEYAALPDDGFRYELVNGVMLMSPSPSPLHQQVVFEISTQIGIFLRQHPIGAAYPDIDVRIASEKVYRPDLVFVAGDRVADNWERITEPPAVVIEVISPDHRRFDRETKFRDYEAFGVGEYWLIDPHTEQLDFYRLSDGKYVQIDIESDAYTSTAMPGFALDLAALRAAFKPRGK